MFHLIHLLEVIFGIQLLNLSKIENYSARQHASLQSNTPICPFPTKYAGTDTDLLFIKCHLLPQSVLTTFGEKKTETQE